MNIFLRNKIVVPFSFIVILTIAASQSLFAQDIRYNFDHDTDFTKFHSYKWVDNKNAQKPDDLGDRQIKSAIDAELAKKSLTKVDTDVADLYISYQVGLSQEKQYTSFDSGYGYGPGWRNWGGSTMSTGQTATIHIGALDLDMYDTAKKQLVWEGLVSKTIDPQAKPDKQQKNLGKAVAKLLKNYPPPQGKD